MMKRVLSLGKKFLLSAVGFTVITSVIAFPLRAQNQTYRLIETVKLGQKLGMKFPSALQPCAIAIDERAHRAYLSSPFSEYFPIIDTDSCRQIGSFSPPFSPGGDRFRLHANSVNGLVYAYPTESPVDSVKTIFAINPAQNTVVTTCSYSVGVTDIALYHKPNLLFVADGSILRVFDGTSLVQTATVNASFPIGSIALDSLHDRLYLVAKDPASGQGRFAIHSLTAPYLAVKVLTFPSTMPVLKAFIDTNWNRFLLAMPNQVRILQLGSNAPVKTVMLNGTYMHFAYSSATERFFAMNDNGYAASGEKGYFGKLLSLGFIDDTRDSVRLGLKPAAMALDEHNKRLGIVLEQQSSLTWYGMDSLNIAANNDVAMHFDDMMLTPDGQTMYIANHFGKSQRLIMYTFVGQEMTEVPSGTWTTCFASDSARARAFSLAHQENTIYILSTFMNTIIGKTPIFGFKEQRGDVLSTMCYDKTRQKMYVSLPEYKSIAVVDLNTAATEKSLKLLGYNGTPANESGIGKIQMALAPDVNKLYVLRTSQKRLNIYNLSNSQLIDSLNLALYWTPTMNPWKENLLTYDPVDKRVYVGSIAIDCGSNKFLHGLPGAGRFVGYNSKETILYSIMQSGASVIVQEHDPKTLTVTASRPLYNSVEPIAPLVYFDSKRNQLFLLDRLEGVLRRYDTKNLVGAAVASNQAEEFVALTVFPNPVNTQATVRFGVKRREKIHLAVYDELGREISVLTDTEYEPGTHTITLKVESTSFTTKSYTLQLKSPSASYTKKFQVAR